MSPIVAFAGYGLAVCVGTWALYLFQRHGQMRKLVAEAMGRIDVAKKQIFYLEENLNKSTDKQTKTRENAAKLEKSLEDSRQRVETLQKQATDQEHAWRSRLETLERQSEHFKEQTSVLTQQLATADRARKDTETQAQQIVVGLEDRLSKVEAQAQEKVREAQGKLRQSQNDIKRLQEDLERAKTSTRVVDPEELKDARRKAVQYEKLYFGMKSLREMSDDRSRNWETALRQFSVWIIANSPKISGLGSGKKTVDNPEGPLGPLVGEAMEIVGAQLVSDDGIDLEAIAQKVIDEPMSF